MATDNKIFRPRRGKKDYMTNNKTVLASGELFFEVPDEGVGTGACRVKMGDGTSVYSDLPYALDGDAQTFEVTFDNPSSSSTNDDFLGMLESGATLSEIITAVKGLLTNINSSVTSIESDSSSGKVGTSTVGSASRPVFLSAGTITACSSTVGAAGRPVFMSSGTITACSSTIGGVSTPVYMSSGTITACSSTVGAAGRPIYSNGGVLTACSSTIGGVSTPVYMSSGTITACSSTVGAAGRPVFMSSGTITACSSTIGTASKPVYMSAGTITAAGTTYGSTTQPVYMNSGSITVCSTMMPVAGSTFTGQAYAYGNANYSTYQIRNTAFSTSVPSSLNNGYICMVYSP